MTAYSFLTTLLWPLVFAYIARIAWRDRSWRYFRQRLGFGYPQADASPLWIHCASVGEVNTLQPLLEKLAQTYPKQRFLITTNTITGAGVAEALQIKNLQHCYLPIDSFGAVTRFLHRLQPRLALVMETEIWPMLYLRCRQRGIPISIINGRLSTKTLHAHSWIKARYADALQCVDHVWCKSQNDFQGFIRLGMDEKRCDVLGNLKFARSFSSDTSAIDELRGRTYVLAASTHHDEELRIARIWKKIAAADSLLVIAPRHPQRAATILQQLKQLGVNVAQRSRGEVPNEASDIYLADTIGELPAFISGAQLVIMGGSLIAHGGHNLLEPASFGKAIVIGPHMENFVEETELALAQQACLQVQSDEELTTALQGLLNDDHQRRQLGEHAARLMAEQSSVASHYLERINSNYGEVLASS
jgi:3-deoxy-D-manno-octulosonic-acid transferase